ncbi:MAG: hypothetical protein ACFFB0_20290 [Promethearchaeota archaeon]
MIFQGGMGGIEIIIITLVLILGSILLFKIGLVITKAQEKTNMKWVAVSFGILFGVTLFISLPLSMTSSERGPDPLIIILVIIFSGLLITNIINIIHKIGLKRSFVLMILILAPIAFTMAIIFSGGTVFR